MRAHGIVRRPAYRLWTALGMALLHACALACSSSEPQRSDIRVEWAIDPSPARLGPNTVEIVLSGAQEGPVSGAELVLEANMTHAGMQPAWASPVEVSPGRYRASVELDMAGDWYLSLEGRLIDGERFVREFGPFSVDRS